ncbi:LysE family translocator [Palleronia sp.]|uniref:LysE family translocator n=1 Tax=Palleronia sp. TaxID=1940284 RepID=UPI0035C7A2EB
MTSDSFLAFVLFAAVATGTPGPNNLMVMASGANFGLRRTVPHILGIALGFALMIALVATGMAQVFGLFPWLEGTLLAASALFLLYLAWKIANAAPPEADRPQGRPLTFLQAAGFQWINPKSWALALTSVAVYVEPSQALIAAMIFAAVALPLVTIWTVAGAWIGRLLRTPRALRLFNIAMAALLVGTMIPAFA